MKRLFPAVIYGLFTLSLSAQVQNARIEGSVADNSHSVIVGAKLSLTNNKTQGGWMLRQMRPVSSRFPWFRRDSIR